MIERKQGHIVSLSSLAALTGAPFMVMYATTKFAVRGFMESLRLDLKAKGHSDYIRTTTVFPSFINTNCAIKEFAEQASKVIVTLGPESVAGTIVNGIVKNRTIVAIPCILKYYGYFM